MISLGHCLELNKAIRASLHLLLDVLLVLDHCSQTHRLCLFRFRRLHSVQQLHYLQLLLLNTVYLLGLLACFPPPPSSRLDQVCQAFRLELLLL